MCFFYEIKTVGGSPTAGYFLLLRQKKISKEKATLPYRPAGSFGRAIKLGSCGTRTTCCAASCSDSPRLHPNFIVHPQRYRREINCQTQKRRNKPGVRIAHTQPQKHQHEGTTRPHTTTLFASAFDSPSPYPPPSSTGESGNSDEYV